MAKTARRRGEGQALKPAIAPRYLEETIEKGLADEVL